MWCAIAMPPYGGFFMAVNPLQKHILRGALQVLDRLVQTPAPTFRSLPGRGPLFGILDPRASLL